MPTKKLTFEFEKETPKSFDGRRESPGQTRIIAAFSSFDIA
jgi:hypothetical protein